MSEAAGTSPIRQSSELKIFPGVAKALTSALDPRHHSANHHGKDGLPFLRRQPGGFLMTRRGDRGGCLYAAAVGKEAMKGASKALTLKSGREH